MQSTIKMVVKRGTKVSHLFVGIDPGSSGAVGFVVGRRAYAVSLPTMKVKKGKSNKTEFILPEIVRAFRKLACLLDQTVVRVALEEPQIMGRAGAFSAMRQGANFGMWPLFLTSFDLPFDVIQPGAWKKAMGVNKDKSNCRMLAMRLFPNLNLPLKKDHDKAEAVLMAEYLRRQCSGTDFATDVSRHLDLATR